MTDDQGADVAGCRYNIKLPVHKVDACSRHCTVLFLCHCRNCLNQDHVRAGCGVNKAGLVLSIGCGLQRPTLHCSLHVTLLFDNGTTDQCAGIEASFQGHGDD